MNKALLSLMALSLGVLTLAEVKYDVTYIPTVPGAIDMTPVSINNNGQVVGTFSIYGSSYRSYLYSSGTTSEIFANYSENYVTGINGYGQYIGCYHLYPGSTLPQIPIANISGTEGLLPTYTSWRGGRASSINSSGQVAGATIDTYEAWLPQWQRYITREYAVATMISGGSIVRLGHLGSNPHNESWATCINDLGQVAGLSDTDDDIFHPFLYQNGTMSELPMLEGSYWDPTSINNAGVVVGSEHGTFPEKRAIKCENGVLTILGDLGYGPSHANCINDQGVIVGYTSHPGPGNGCAALFKNGQVYDLNELVVAAMGGDRIVNAYGINNSGQIVAGTYYGNSVILTPRSMISGTVSLLRFFGDITNMPIVFELRIPGTTTVVDTITSNLAADGSFEISSSLEGTYDITAKGSHWLRKNVSNIAISHGNYATVSFSLTNGDVDGNNTVNMLDYNIWASHYRETPSSPNWNPNADLDGDLSVSLLDYNIISQSWNKQGD